jgi:hypothetical protein
MNFLKKNWGFLLFGTLALAAIITLLCFCISTSSQLNQARTQEETFEKNISAIASKNTRLTQDNIDRAEKNAKSMQEKQETMKQEFIDTFNIKSDPPKIVLDAFAQLRRELVEMDAFAEKQGIYIPGNGTFTFASIVNATQPPAAQDLPDIFRNLAIVKTILQIAAQSDIKEIDDIVRLAGLQAQSDSFFLYTPIEVTVTAPPDVVQRFVNAMAMCPNMLFVLQSVKVTSNDNPTALANDLRNKNLVDAGAAMTGMGTRSGNTTADEASARAMSIMTGTLKTSTGAAGTGAAPLMDDTMMNKKSSRRKNTTTPTIPDPMMNAGMGGLALPGAGGAMLKDDQQAGYVEVPVSRQDFLAFRKKESTWELRFDLIEFPVEKNEEEESDNAEEGDFEDTEDTGEDAQEPSSEEGAEL